jgi:hypothetical protein
MTWQPDLWSYNVGETRRSVRATNVAEADEAEKRHQKPTQANRILAYLRAGNRLTALEALERFQCFRLAARVHELRREGHRIEEQMVETPSGKRVAQYWVCDVDLMIDEKERL